MFLIPCPNCGERSVSEFRFGGELSRRPAESQDPQVWAHYLYARKNVLGEQTEWWHHRQGCRRWFLARRNTLTNKVLASFWPEDAPEEVGQVAQEQVALRVPGTEA